MKFQSLLSAMAVAATSFLLQLAAAGSLPADVLFQEDFENPDVPSYLEGITPDIWVRATAGFGAGDHGLTDKSGGDFTAPSGNEQAYALRYTNSGITSADKAMGPPLVFGGGYQVSFDVVRDNSNSGRAYDVKLIAFGTGAARYDCRSIPTGSTVLASATGNAPSDGSIATVTFTFIPNATTHAAEFGKDLGLRVIGSGSSAIIDNIRLRAVPGTGTGLSLVTTAPLDNSVNNLATNPIKAVFNKNIAAGTGNITLRNLTNSIDTVISVGDSRISLSGTCLDIVPDAPFTWGKDYAILIDPTAVVETPGGTPFIGIAAQTEWNFTTAGGDPLLYSISRLKDHINGVITLSAAEINTIKLNLDTVVSRFAESSTSIAALLDLITTYDTVKGPLWVSRSLPKRASVTNDLHWTIFTVMQNIMDRIYTGQTLAAHESLLNGFKFGSSSNFPGACAVPAPNTYTAKISANYLKTYGPSTLGDGPGTYARKPTGTYLAPGTIATIQVPMSMVGTGYKIRVGCHSWDFSAKPDIKRLDRVTRVYDISALQTKVASPLGGGIYIEVPFLANVGVLPVDIIITGAVRSPFFSARSGLQTTPTEWLTERANPAPWADFQSDKFMMQVPKTWISAMPDPTQLMADWDKAMDAVNDLMGYTAFNPDTSPNKYIRGKETMYPQVDLLLKNSVYAPGYPSVNTTYSPTGNYGGYASSHLVRGPQNAPDYEFHEQGHGYLFPKFGGESESAVNLAHVAVWNRKFGKSMDESFRKSRGYTNTYMTLNTTAMAWMCVFNFSPREVPMASGEKAYQLKGHAKFVDIANLYGWDVLGNFWGTMVDAEEHNIAYATDDDSMLLRLCKSVGKDIRPLFHFWGIYPQNPTALAASIAAANPPIPKDIAIRNRLLEYKALIPANNAAFRTFATGWWSKQPSINGYWEEREHARQWDTTALYGVGDQQRSQATNPGEIYNENSANDIRNRVDELIQLYFPGALSPAQMSFAVVPTAMNTTTIGMTAITATSGNGPVEYYFENITNNSNSGWLTSRSWNPTGLTTGVSYSFRVKARDGVDETAWSATASATPQTDTLPPSPSPMVFASPPLADNVSSISMAAATATDINGVEYYFENTAGAGHDSGWQDSSSYTDTGLNPGTPYTYRVRARDKSAAQNPTAWSVALSATTKVPDVTNPMILSLNPADNAGVVLVTSNLVVTFDEPIQVNTGSIIIKNLTDSTQTVIDVNDASQVVVTGDLLTINPTVNLVSGKAFSVRIDANAFQDTSENPFAGINDDTTWNFTTEILPYVWTQTAGNAQDWATNTNWLAGTSPSPISGDTVDFSTANIIATTTLTLGADRTAQLWKFGDAATASHDWIVNSGNKMILAGTTEPTINVVNRTATLNNVVDGSAGLTKTGGGTLALANPANTYTGGTVISAGNLTIAADGSLGAAGSTVTVNANATINLPSSPFTFNRPFVLNNGASLAPSFTSSVLTVNGAVTGTGSIAPYNQSGAILTLASTANSFTGSFQLAAGIQQGTIIVNSIGDGGIVYLGTQAGSGSNYGQANFRYGSGATAPLVLNSRQFQLGTAGGGKGVIQNDNTTSSNANTLTINTDLLAPNTGARTLELGGANTGNNTFAGKIIDGNGTISLSKAGAGTWALSGANTYNGTTVNGFSNPASGSFIFQGIQALSPTTTLSQSHVGGTGGFVTIKLLDDAASPASRTAVNLAMSASNTSHTMSLFVGNNGSGNGGNGSGGTIGSTISLGNLNITQSATGNTSQTLAVSGANGYRLQINNVTPTLQAGSGAWTANLIADAPLSVAGNVQQTGNGSAGTTTLALSGGSSASLISGNILNSADGTPKVLTLAKSGAGTWTLTGTSGYSGLTTISGGVLQLGDGTFGNDGTIENTSGITNNATLVFNRFGNLSSDVSISGTGSVTKTGAGSQTLTGPNTYTGTTTASVGKLFINGSLSNTPATLTVASGATLGGTGTIGRNVTIAAGAKLEFNLSAAAASHDRLDISAGRSFAFSGASELTITSSGGMTPGTYTLITGGDNITGVAPTIVNMPVGWSATASISGNSLRLNVVGPVDHFAISSIGSTQIVGTPITGVTITAQDVSNNTATSFTGTVTFGGTGGFSGPSAAFVAGVLSGVSVTPTVTGSNLTLTVNDGASHIGSTTVATIQTQYAVWSGGALFSADTNDDGFENGVAWLLGANDPSANVAAIRPTLDNTSDPNYFIYTYRRSDAANTDPNTSITVLYSTDLSTWIPATHDGSNIIITPTDNFYSASPGIDKVQVKLKRTLTTNGRFYIRIKVTTTP